MQLSKKEIKLLAKPWIISGLSISIKDKLYRKYMASRSEFHRVRYKIYRNKLNRLLLLSKKFYYTNYFNVNKCDIKNTAWKGIKRIIFSTLCNMRSKLIPTDHIYISYL